MNCDRRARRLAVAVCVVCLLGAGVAHADAKSEARNRMQEGSALYRRGDYQAALRKFEEARALYPSPKIYFNLGQALSRLGRVAAAVDAFEKFLAEAPDVATAVRLDAERLLRELRPRIGFVRIVVPAGWEIALDGQTVGVTPLHRTIPADPGAHQLTARAPGASVGHVSSIEVTAGETVDWDPGSAPPPLADGPAPTIGTPPSLAVPPPPLSHPPTRVVSVPDREPPPLYRRWWPWAIAGTVVAGAVAAALLITREEAPTGTLGAVRAPGR